MKKSLVFIVCLLFFSIAFSQVTVSDLLCNNLKNPVGIGTAKPRFSWQLNSTQRNVKQAAYEIKVSNGKEVVWSSGKINSDKSVMVDYAGKSLQSGKKYNWQVRVWDNNGKASAWSSLASFQTALLDKAEWKAKWITPSYEEDALRASPLFRKEFSSAKKIVNATAYITSHGLYEAQINGQRVGDAYLTPGWTAYKKRLQFQAYDVTGLLKNGNNAIGVTLGSGWYRGIIGFTNSVNVYGKDIALLFQLVITYSDGSTESIVSDESWKSSTGSIVYAEIYNGETIDARKEKKGWALPGYNDAAWSSAKVADFSKDVLVAEENEPVKKHETFKPVKIFTTPKGEKVLDFGQNLVGWVMLKAKGNAGDKIVLSHAEVLDKYGNFYTDNLREAKAQDAYILKGGEEESFEPHFTWQGFRYIRIEGYPGEIKPENFTAVALYSDMQPTGTFTSSNPLINQLQHNIQWGQKGNFLDVPTDCPQRDERLGWTGDAQVFSRTASFNMNVHSFFSKWLKDVDADQQKGVVPFVIPNVLGAAISSAGWADVATIIPWNMYLAYGDKQILENQYSSMKAYVESIRAIAKDNLWNSGFHFGDWLFYRPEDDNDGRAAVTDKYLIAQCFYANSTQLLINAANVLGKTDEVNNYTALLSKIKEAFNKEYVTNNGRLVSSTQTAYVLALNFDMLPEALREQAAKRLAENVKSYGNHLTTGFLGTPYLCHVLTRYGYTDVAYKLLLQETYPSWLYPVKMGATTIWERWDGQKPDSTFQTPGMNSFNHYSYGAIGDWMYRKMVGLDTYEDGVGYKHIKVKPYIGGGLTAASASLQTYYGKLSSGWKVNADNITMDVEIPANTTATIYIPADNAEAITEGGKPLTAVADIKIVGKEENYVVVNVGSGTYHCVAAKPKAETVTINTEEYIGEYKVAEGMISKIEVKAKEGKLILLVYNNSGELDPVKGVKDQFSGADGSVVNFIRDSNGKVIKVKLSALGMLFEGTKQ
ncbi:MAG: family 78 glycoside hydrolase catalytic domain [Sphingobacteriales bacterium]|nr:family 78 glycoside hydrolase catalytic domain [Sphingobacteriales bacterium]